MKRKPTTKSDALEQLRGSIRAWKEWHQLTDPQVVAFMAIVAHGYAENAYVELPHQKGPSAEPYKQED
jgi:hypothetical protein